MVKIGRPPRTLTNIVKMPFFYENHKDAYGTTDTRVGRTQQVGKKKD